MRNPCFWKWIENQSSKDPEALAIVRWNKKSFYPMHHFAGYNSAKTMLQETEAPVEMFRILEVLLTKFYNKRSRNATSQ